MEKKPRYHFRLRLDLPTRTTGYREVFPFQKSWIAISIVLVMDAIFGGIAVNTFFEAAREWGRFETLFDLVSALFLSGWLLGWSVAPAILTLILFLMLFGREVVRAYEGTVEVGIGLPGLVLAASFDVSRMRNLRLEKPTQKSGKSWRGQHMVFDYGGGVIEFGSAIDVEQMAEVSHQIKVATGSAIRAGRLLSHVAREAGQLDETQAEEDARKSPEKILETQQDNKPLTLSSPSTLVLIAANLVPILGALFFEWNLSDVMVTYWAESAVIGFYNICKMVVVGRWMVLLSGPFFLGHFGAFMSIHFLFIYTIFIEGSQGSMSGGNLAEVIQLFIGLWPALGMLFISHGISFFQNFLGRQEYVGRTLQQQMTDPYSRIIFMHLVLIFGGGLSLILGSPTLVIVLAIAIKIVIDIKAHLKEHAPRDLD